MKFQASALAVSLLAIAAALATPYANYIADLNQTPQDPTSQGWTVSAGGISQGVDDNGTLAWLLNDNGSTPNPTMFKDFGAASVPASGDPWSLSVTAKIGYGNGQADNLIQWSNGTTRYLVFVYADSASGGNIDVSYSNGSGLSVAQNVALNDNGYHTWAIVHDGGGAKLTRDGVDVVTIGTLAAGGQARGIHVGGGSSAGQGALQITSVSYDATLAPPPAATKLARVFGSQMVLQRGEPVPVFGTDTGAANQAIAVTFAGQTKNTTTDANGKWMVTLDPMPANPVGQTLTVTGSSTATLTDVLVGEVWLAAGQSNMNWTVSSSSGTPKAANFSLVRMCNWEASVGTGASQVYSATDFEKLTADGFFTGSWQAMSATTVGPQSGVAWYFASELADALKGSGPGGVDVPVGVLDCSVGGTSTESYIPASALMADPELKIPFRMPKTSPALGQWTASRIAKNLGTYTQADLTAPHPHPYAPGFLYHTGIAPVLPFTFKGVIFYQGESNAEFTDVETGADVSHGRSGQWVSDYQFHVMETLVDSWRAAFAKPDLPFYQVQLPRINDANRTKWPWYREAQQRLDAARDNVETAVVTEFGVNGSNVHPAAKEPVGVRLARIARAKLYGETNLESSGPRLSKQTISGNKIILEFTHTGGGLVASDGAALRHFEIAGLDRDFVPATATIIGDTVEVTAAAVPAPLAVRYAWTMNPDVNFKNRNGSVDLSASPFRTDRWMVADLGRKIRVACIGDSITYGTGTANLATQSYPVQLAKLLGTTNFEVMNFGKPGARVNPAAANRYETSNEFTNAKAYDPDIVICNLGINDITEWGSYTSAQFMQEYRDIISGFASNPNNDPIFLCWHELAPLFPGQTFYDSPNLPLLNTLIGDTLSFLGVHRIDMFQPLKDHEPWFPDNIHPNAAGARKIAEVTFEFLGTLDAFDANPRISEFQSINFNGLQDNDGDFSGWIELVNLGTTGASLSGHFLTPSTAVPTLWQIPATVVLDPGARLLVFASGKNRAIADSPLHTNFTLPAHGGPLALVAPDATTVIHQLGPYPVQLPGYSYGTDENDASSYFSTPTPGAANDSGKPPYAAWKEYHGVTSDTADDDGDGIVALAEFLSGSDPESSASAHRPEALVVSLGDDYFGVRFREAKNLTGASRTLEVSTDLGLSDAWQPAIGAVLVSSADGGDGTELRTYRLADPINASSCRFLRIAYTYDE